MITDEQLKILARKDIVQAVNSFCMGAAEQSEVLYEQFPEEFNGDSNWEDLIDRYDRIVKSVRDEVLMGGEASDGL